MKRIIITLIAAFAALAPLRAITLDECIDKARANYPLIKRYALIDNTADIDLSDVNKSWLPRVCAYAQATVQNHVPGFPDNMQAMFSNMGVEFQGLRKDQYKIGVDVNQTIWDGGKSKADRDITRADALAQTAANDVGLYAVAERVQNIYFAILLTEAQVEQCRLTTGLLTSNLDRLHSMQTNGTAMQCDVDAVEAELLTVKQNTVRLQGMADGYRRILEYFIGEPLSEVILECPSPDFPENLQSARPELAQFDAQLATIESQRRSVSVATMPHIGLFAQAYYGYPGFDYFNSMMSRDWSFNVMAGVKVSWTIDAFYNKKNRLNKLSVASAEVENAREVFRFNTDMAAIQQQADIDRQQAVIGEDARIVELRASVRRAAESRLANGIIDTTDLLGKITDEATAGVNSAYHRIELVKTIYQLKFTLNQ